MLTARYWPARAWPTDYWPEAPAAPGPAGLVFAWPSDYWPAYWAEYWPDYGISLERLTAAPAGAAVQFLVADVAGRVLTEIRPAIHRVAWRWNATGSLSFSLAKTDPKLREEYFVGGNRIMLQFSNGLPDWGGVITGAQDWSDAAVTLEGYSGAWALAQRRTGRGRVFQETTAGAILTALLQEADAVYAAGLRAGNIWQGGGVYNREYVRQTLYDVVTDDLVGAGAVGAFDVTPALENGYIVFYVNLYERQGADRPGVALVESRNVTGIRYRKIDEAINVWHMAGEGDGWTDTARAYATATNEESMGRHGMREGSEVRSGETSQSALEATAASRVAATAWPVRVLGLTVMDDAPGRFRDYGVGDAVTARLHSYDFNGVNGLFEVRGREFFPAEGTADLVLLEV